MSWDEGETLLIHREEEEEEKKKNDNTRIWSVDNYMRNMNWVTSKNKCVGLD